MPSAPDPASDTASPAVGVPARSHAAVTGSSVRRNAIWAAGAAAVMLWYGLGDWDLENAPSGVLMLVYTLQAGGALMALSAIFSLTGLRAALIFDAIVSAAIGVAMLICAALLYASHSTQALLNLLFGLVFIHSGYRNWQDYRALAPHEAPGGPAGSNGIEV